MSNVDLKFRLSTPEHTDWSTPVMFRMPFTRLTKWHKSRGHPPTDGGHEKDQQHHLTTTSCVDDSDDNMLNNSDRPESESASEEEDSAAIVSRAYIPGTETTLS